jgi:hypothetical protein
MTAQSVSFNEIWALAKQHTVHNGTKMPKVNGDKKIMVEGKEVFFYIDNEPTIYYSVGHKNSEKHQLYIDCIELYDWDDYDKSTDIPVISNSESLGKTLKQKISD